MAWACLSFACTREKKMEKQKNSGIGDVAVQRKKKSVRMQSSVKSVDTHGKYFIPYSRIHVTYFFFVLIFYTPAKARLCAICSWTVRWKCCQWTKTRDKITGICRTIGKFICRYTKVNLVQSNSNLCYVDCVCSASSIAIVVLFARVRAIPMCKVNPSGLEVVRLGWLRLYWMRWTLQSVALFL